MHLPVSKATNAYELLDEVCEVILEEPKRYYQGWWRVTPNGKEYVPRTPAIEALVFPACDTICCVAGWVCTLKSRITPDLFSSQARFILGINTDEAWELFRSSAVADIDPAAKPQTLEYAQAGVTHIRRFMAKYELRLKAKAV